MRIALVGKGKMATAVASAADEEGWEVCVSFDRANPFTGAKRRDDLNGAIAVIDFSSARVAEEHVRRCLDWRIPLVLGTTGSEIDQDRLRSMVEVSKGAVLYSPNFSLGVAIIRRALRVSLSLAGHLGDVDVAIQEVHHAEKRDRPSGTARQLADDVRRQLPWKYANGDELSTIMGLPDGPDVSSLRVGAVFGEHTVRLEGPDDQIVLSHSARSRRGFAMGALQAARWLAGRTGFFTMDDMLDDWLGHSPSTISNGRMAVTI